MSTIAPPSKPLNPALVDSEHYIEDKIRRTRRALKLVDLAAGVITLAIGLMGFVLLAAVLDHWVVPGGLNEAGRLAVFGLMLLAVAWYGWRQFVPLLRSINPVYAAHTIERGTPSLKNSLLNLLVFRTHRHQLSPRVYHALEQQAAQRLSTAPLDTAIDRSALLRLGYALLLIIAVCAAYGLLSPKNMAVSVARVVAPWSDLQAPSRVQIMNIRPGDISLAVGERLEIEATIGGLRADDAVRVRYSTADEQLVDESVSMKTPDAGIGRFVAHLPRGGEAADAGVQQSFVYWIEAGDARSKKFKVTVFSRPTLIVQKVQYEYPAYTGFPSNEVENTGDIRGIEGTRVTIFAVANQPIKSAYIDFDADGRNDKRMTVEGKHATANFPLALREDRRTPEHVSYLLRFTSAEGRINTDPPKYQVDVTPDYAPEVRITSPEEPERIVRVDETVPIEIEARDPDFALGGVRLVGKVGDREATLAELLTKKHEGRFGSIELFTPGEVQLKAGDVLEYWAEARDNRQPDANVALSEHRRFRIAGAVQQPPPNGQQQQPKQQPNGGEQRRDGQQPQKGENAEGGEQGQGGQPQQGDQAGADSEVTEGEGQQGPGGAGAEGQQNEKAESQDGAGGQGQAGESQSNDAQQQEGNGGAGGSSANNGEQSQGAESAGANAGDPASAGGPDQQGQSQGAQGQPGSPQDGQQGGAQEKVSSDGSDDASAMQKLAEKLNPQDGSEPSKAGNQQGQPQDAAGQTGAAQNNAAQEGADPSDSNKNTAEQAGADAASRTQGQQGQAGESASAGKPNAQQEGADPAGAQAKPGEQANQAGQPQSAKSPPDSSSSAASGSKNKTNQKPQAEGAQAGASPREKGGDAEQQSQGAGQSPDQPQGADIPRESKTGDGNPGEDKDAQKPSAESVTNENQGNAGAGHNSDEQEGSPSSPAKKAVDKQDAGDRNKKLMGDEEPPSGADSKRESDSDGGQGGDQAGGGQQGAGQHADAPGMGESGQNEAADTGAGRADERGMGETGTEAGRDQLAEGKTGESSGDKPGEGSQQGEAGQSGESAAAGGPDGKQPGASAKPEAGKQGAQPDAQAAKSANAPTDGSAPGDQGEPASEAGGETPPAGDSSQPSQGQPGVQQPSQQSGGEGASSASPPQGGGQGGPMTGNAQQQTEEAKADEANLEYARKQTDLVLERLDEQLAKKQVDAELLKSLGWSETELSQFVSRWKNLKTRAESEGNDGDEARQELDDSLRSLGLRPRGPSRVQATTKADQLRVKDSYRSRAPIEYADRVRMYSKNVAAGGGGNAK